MGDSVYRKTPLPARLNLNDRNTKVQLSSGVSEKESGRGALEGVGCSQPALQSKQDCSNVMRDELKAWLVSKGVEGPFPSPEEEQRAMWEWIRQFHKEYNDDWFTINMPRLHAQFKPTFMAEMKVMKSQNQSKQQPPSNASTANLLETDVAQAPSTSANDLMSFEVANAAGSTATAGAPASGLDSLLDLSSALPFDVSAPQKTPQPAIPTSVDNLFGLDFGTDNSAVNACAAPMAPAVPALPVEPTKANASLLDGGLLSFDTPSNLPQNNSNAKETSLLDIVF